MDRQSSDSFEFYGINPEEAWSSHVFLRVYPGETLPTRVGILPLGYVFIIEPAQNSPQYKLPGGHKHKEVRETPLQTAIREGHGETGIPLKAGSMRYAGKWYRTRPIPHWKFLFVAHVTEEERNWMNNHHRENEGEEPKFFTPEEFYRLVRAGKFMQEHFDKLVEFSLILPELRC